MLRKVIRYVIMRLPYIIFLVFLGKQGIHGLWAAVATFYLSGVSIRQFELSLQQANHEVTFPGLRKMNAAWLVFVPTAAVGLAINYCLPQSFDVYLAIILCLLLFSSNLPTRRRLKYVRTQLDQGQELLQQLKEKLLIAQTKEKKGKLKPKEEIIVLSEAKIALAKSAQLLANALGKIPDDFALEVPNAESKAKENTESELNHSSLDEPNRRSL